MLAFTVVFALASAFLNAAATILQRRATGDIVPEKLFHHSIVRAAMRQRLWLIGVGLEVLGFFAQAAALRHGSLVIVGPLLTADLLFLVALLTFRFGVPMGVREWSAAALLTAGLASLIADTNPTGGHPTTSFDHWFTALLVIAGIIVIGALVMRRTQIGTTRGILGGTVAGLHFAFTAVATKLTLAELSAHGFWHLFVTWQLYALIVVGVSSVFSMQSMYGAGSLIITQPALEITEAVAGVIFGLVLFGDHIRHPLGVPGTLAAASASGLAICIGIVLLASSRRLHRG